MISKIKKSKINYFNIFLNKKIFQKTQYTPNTLHSTVQLQTDDS